MRDEGMSVAEIADRTGWSYSTVSTHTSRASATS